MLAGIPLHVLPLPRPAMPPRSHQATRADHHLRLVSWGGLVPGKGLELALRAAEAASREGTITLDHHGRIIDEDFARRLRSLAKRVRLTLHGPFRRSEMETLLLDHDLAVFPSMFLETHGLAVDEALELGLPVVVSDRGAPRERIGSRGVVVPVGDEAALAEVFVEFLRNPSSLADLRAGTPAASVTMDQHLQSLTTIYEEAIAGFIPAAPPAS